MPFRKRYGSHIDDNLVRPHRESLLRILIEALDQSLRPTTILNHIGHRYIDFHIGVRRIFLCGYFYVVYVLCGSIYHGPNKAKISSNFLKSDFPVRPHH